VAERAADLVSGAHWLRLAERGIQESGWESHHPTARDHLLVRIRSLHGAGDFQSGLLLARRFVDEPDPSAESHRAVQALLLGRLEHGDRDPAAGECHVRAALALAGALKLPEVHVDAAVQLFERLSIDGRLKECEAQLAEAEDALGDAAEPCARALLQNTRARLSLHLSDYADVVLRYRELLARPFVQGNARFEGQAHLALGEVHRLRGDLDRAVRSYAQAEALLADSGAAIGWLPRLNRGLVLVARGEHAAARNQAEQCWHTAVQLGLTGILPPAAALVIRHRAGEADERSFQDALRELTEAAGSGGAAEAAYVELMREAAAAALAIDRPDRAGQLWRLTAVVLRQLDRDDEACELERQLKGR
jgi:tetratricopeptide (TPR) repeat protein